VSGVCEAAADTIVVFDRIREELKAGRTGSIAQIMNRAINETLSRTILTGGVTLLTTIILFFLGGPVLGDFALVMLIGVVVGTYSSVFIAAPIVLWWSTRGGRDLKSEIKRAEEANRAATA
jgi:preprotein translocase subunit SecF